MTHDFKLYDFLVPYAYIILTKNLIIINMHPYDLLEYDQFILY